MRGSAIALAAAIGGALIAPASPLADEPPAPPVAALTTAHASFPAGRTITLDSSASRPGTGAIVGHVWDLDGNGSFETDTGSKPTVETVPLHPGPMTVHVRVVDDRGLASDAALALDVQAPPDPAIDKSSVGSDTAKQPTQAPAASTGSEQQPQEAGTPPATPAPTSPAAPAPTPATPAPAPPPPAGPAPTPQPQPAVASPPPTTARMSATPVLLPRKTLATSKKTTTPAAVTVTAAASSGVNIKNFAFTPATVSVHVGDTITWSNNDIAPHTATASDGSFNTGTINQGKSASHTFSKAGTFAYICSIHPQMHGTVTVAAASSTTSGTNPSSGGGGSGGGGGGGTSPTTTTSSNLPHTGLDIAAVVLLAMLMMGSGTLLRSRVS